MLLDRSLLSKTVLHSTSQKLEDVDTMIAVADNGGGDLAEEQEERCCIKVYVQ